MAPNESIVSKTRFLINFLVSLFLCLVGFEMASALVLRCQFKGGQRKVLNGLTSSSPVSDLQEKIFLLTDVPIQRQKVLFGFPPKELDLSNVNAPLTSIEVRSGDTLIVEENKAMPRVINTNLGSPSNSKSRMVRKTIPADNSCLFASISFLMLGGDTSLSGHLRQLVGQVILDNPVYFNEALLGKPVDEYCRWIQDDTHWGGAIEITALSSHFKIQIDVVDVQSGRVDQFGQDKGYSQRIFLIYDGIHYDPLYKEIDVKNTNGSNQMTFSTNDDLSVAEALEVAAEAQQKRQFTDLTKFSLRCITCNTGLSGQSDATRHAKETGHTNFGEV